MSPTAQKLYGEISQNVYNDMTWEGAPAGDNDIKNNEHWIKTSDQPLVSSDGFQAAVYQKGNEIVIAYAGTNPLDFDGDDFNDAQIYGGEVPDQYPAAISFYHQIESAYPGAEITVTGHSLGGALAQLVGAVSGADTYKMQVNNNI